MAADYSKQLRAAPFLGLDLRSNKLSQKPGSFSDTRNVYFDYRGQVVTHPGSQWKTPYLADGTSSIDLQFEAGLGKSLSGAYGLAAYKPQFDNNVVTSTVQSDELIAFGRELHAFTPVTFLVTSDSADTAWSLLASESGFTFTVTVDGAVAYTQDLGTGYEEVPVTVGDVIDGLEAAGLTVEYSAEEGRFAKLPLRNYGAARGAVAYNGLLYFFDSTYNAASTDPMVLYSCDPVTGSVALVAGGTLTSLIDGTGTAAGFSDPRKLVADGGYLYCLDFSGVNVYLRRIDPATGVVASFDTGVDSGGAQLVFGLAVGTNPSTLDQEFWFSCQNSSNNYQIFYATAWGIAFSTASVPQQGGALALVDDYIYCLANYNAVTGNLFGWGVYRSPRVGPSWTLVAGTGTSSSGDVDGSGLSAQFGSAVIYATMVVCNGSLYVIDNTKVKRLLLGSSYEVLSVQSVAGTAATAGYTDGYGVGNSTITLSGGNAAVLTNYVGDRLLVIELNGVAQFNTSNNHLYRYFRQDIEVDYTVPAACIDLLSETGETTKLTWLNPKTIQQQDSSGSCAVLSAVNKTGGTQWDPYNVESTQIGGVMYYIGKSFPLCKYDGKSTTLAGLAAPDAPVAAVGLAGALTGEYQYGLTLETTDATGVVIESDMGELDTVTLAAQRGRITLPTVTTTESLGFGSLIARYGIVQTTISQYAYTGNSATLLVGNAHGFVAGQTAYVSDGDAATTTESATISFVDYDANLIFLESALAVSDSTMGNGTFRVSNGCFNIWRSQAGGDLLYFIAAIGVGIAYDSNPYYYDNTADASVGEEYVLPEQPHSLPPSGTHITNHQGKLVIASGRTDLVQGAQLTNLAVSFSSTDGNEYFPAENQFYLPSNAGSEIVALVSHDDILYVLTDQRVYAVIGLLDTASFSVREISTFGAASSAIFYDKSSTPMFISRFGVSALASNSVQVLPDVTGTVFGSVDRRLRSTKGFASTTTLATASLDAEQRYYLVSVPKVNFFQYSEAPQVVNSGSLLEESDVYLVHLDSGAWMKLTGIDASGGIVTANNETWFLSREVRETGLLHSRIGRLLREGPTASYLWHTTALEDSFSSSWEFFTTPGVDKQAPKFRLYSTDPDANGTFSVDVSVEADFKPGLVVAQKTVDFGVGGYATIPYGQQAYAADGAAPPYLNVGNQKLTALRLCFSNPEAGERMTITGWELELATPFRNNT